MHSHLDIFPRFRAREQWVVWPVNLALASGILTSQTSCVFMRFCDAGNHQLIALQVVTFPSSLSAESTTQVVRFWCDHPSAYACNNFRFCIPVLARFSITKARNKTTIPALLFNQNERIRTKPGR